MLIWFDQHLCMRRYSSAAADAFEGGLVIGCWGSCECGVQTSSGTSRGPGETYECYQIQFHPNFNCKINCQFSHLSCSGVGWRAKVHPNSHPVNQLEFDVVIGADGRRNTLPGICKNTWSQACCDHRLSNQKCNKQMIQSVINMNPYWSW